MKPSANSRKSTPPRDKNILRQLAAKDRRFGLKLKNTKRLKIVQSVHAGHVRGGHSFH